MHALLHRACTFCGAVSGDVLAGPTNYICRACVNAATAAIAM